MNYPNHIFITATDTDAGKTYVTGLIAKALIDNGEQVALYKPIASGAQNKKDPMTNDDVAQHAKIDPEIPASLINIWCFEPAIAPHIAAAEESVPLNLKLIDIKLKELIQSRLKFKPYTIGLIEGAGGWKLPINEEETLDQWVLQQDLGIILVVGMKLGCINHALLTVEQILNSNGRLLGWIANIPKEMDRLDENLKTLKNLIPVPCLAEIQPGQTELKIDLDLNVLGKDNEQGCSFKSSRL